MSAKNKRIEGVGLEHCRTMIVRLLADGHDKAAIVELVGCTEYAVTRAAATMAAYDRDIVRALADCRQDVENRPAYERQEVG